MPYSAALALRVRAALSGRRGVTEKKMFGGIAFLLHGNLCVAVWGDGLIVRLGAEGAAAALAEPYAMPFAGAGRPMKGWVLVAADGVERDAALAAWIERALAFTLTLPRK